MQPFSNTEQKNFWYAGIAAAAVGVCFCAFLYFSPLSFNDVMPECWFYHSFGLYCPGCGGTRAVTSFFNGRIISSIGYNAFVPYVFSVFGIFMISSFLHYVFNIKRRFLLRPVYFYIAAFIIVGQCLIKNTVVLFF